MVKLSQTTSEIKYLKFSRGIDQIIVYTAGIDDCHCQRYVMWFLASACKGNCFEMFG